MAEPTQDLTEREQLHEELTAYLDGELDAAATSRIEQRLARDPHVRSELQSLQRSWDMLDDLPRANVDETFLRTTVQMITLAAEKDVQQARATAPRERRRWWIVAALSMLLATGVGFAAVTYLHPDANRPLLTDLATIENVDLYRYVPDVEFLQHLEAEHLFADETVAAPDAIPSTLDERRVRVEKMSSTEKQRLDQQFQQFQELSPEEQQRLRKLDHDLAVSPQAAELRETLLRYHEWLKTLLPPQRTELLELDSAKRLARIKELSQEPPQVLAGGGSVLSRPDRAALMRWMQQFVKSHEEELLAELKPVRAQELNKLEEGPRHWRESAMFIARWLKPEPDTSSTIAPVDLKALAERLSPEGRQLLEAAPTPAEQSRLVAQWLKDASGNRGRMGPPRNWPSSEELEKFRKTELTDEDRQTISALPADEQQRELRKRYWKVHKPPEGWPQRSGDGPRPGPGRGGNKPPAKPDDAPPKDPAT